MPSFPLCSRKHFHHYHFKFRKFLSSILHIALCHLTCKNGVKERKKHHQTNTNSIKESKHGMTKRICVKGFNSVDGIRTDTFSQWIYIHHFFTCYRAVKDFGKVFTIFSSPEIVPVHFLQSQPIIQ